MPKYVKSSPDEIVDAFQVRKDGPTPVPDWFPSDYEIVKVGVVFESSLGNYEVARWEDYVIKYDSSGYLGIMPEKLFNYAYKLA
jgi:hypothetical protein